MVEIRNWFMAAPWNKVYDFLEFLASLVPEPFGLNFAKGCNAVLERDASAYRFVGLKVAPIVSRSEINEVQEALAHAPGPVKTHLDGALTLLSDKENPNYRKSVDESISAVEAAVRDLTGNPKALLPEGLKALGDAIHRHSEKPY